MRLYWPIEELLVHLFEVEGVVEGTAQPRVLELLAPQVEHEALHAAGIRDREFFLEHALVDDRRKFVGRCPLLGGVFRDPVGLVGLEGLQRHVVVAEVFVAHLVEIVLSDPYRQIGAPVILHPFEGDRPAGDEFLDAVRRRSRAASPAWSRRCRACGPGRRCLPTNASAAPGIRRRWSAVRDCRGVEGELDIALADFSRT